MKMTKKIMKKIMKNKMKYLQTYNESIKQFLKPKSEEDIENSIKNLTPDEKIIQGCKYNIIWLIKQGLDEGGDPTYRTYESFEYAIVFDNYESIEFLLNNISSDINIGTNENYLIWVAVHNESIDIIKLLLNDKNVLKKSIKDGDIDHFIELVYNKFKDEEWLNNISKRIDKLKLQ